LFDDYGYLKRSKIQRYCGQVYYHEAATNIYSLNARIDGYTDRYSIGSGLKGQPLVGILPAGKSIYFERAIRRGSVNASSEYLEGTIEYKTKTYPISWFLGLSDGNTKDFWTSLHYDLNIPTSPLEATATPARVYN